MNDFLKLFLSTIAISLVSGVSSADDLAKVRTEILRESQAIDFEGRRHQLDFYFDSALALSSKSAEKVPGIVLAPEFWGNDELTSADARMLAQQGYLVMAVDLYGESRHSRSSAEAEALMERAQAKGIEPLVELIGRAVEVLKKNEHVDPSRIGAVGFGFGGGLLFNFAKTGVSGLQSVVSFYGGTLRLRETSQIGQLPAFLYIRPDEDAYTSADDIRDLRRDLAKTRFQFEMFRLKGASYGFVHSEIESYGLDGPKTHMYYEPAATRLAWEKTFDFLKKTLEPVKRSQ